MKKPTGTESKMLKMDGYIFKIKIQSIEPILIKFQHKYTHVYHINKI
jgi:hypothetical protein